MRLALLVLACASSALAALNGHCHNNRVPGTCVTTTDCTAAGGTYQSGNCPNDPTNVRCCTKSRCDASGTCRWTDSGVSGCSGSTKAGLCPGPTAFKCCLATGTWPRPSIPSYNCKAHVIAAGRRALDAFPGETKTVYCYANKPGDHGRGLALDMMVGTYNPAGWRMAEWAMNNHASLRVKYVMWGQRIWNAGFESPKAWEQWRPQGPASGLTANHWDHVHISFNA